jgi:hypothetical protein
MRISAYRALMPADGLSLAEAEMTTERAPFPPGARRVDRPGEAKPCSNCGELLGRGYPDCAICAEWIDDLWWADWRALLDAEQIRPGTGEERALAERVLDQEVGQYPWTCTDWALWLMRCRRCGGQLGSGDRECVACAAADQARWAWDYAGMPHAMTANEHALRVAVAGLRAPHRHRRSVVDGWRLALPFLFVGEVPSSIQAQRIRGHILAGRYPKLAEQGSLTDMANLPDVPWRTAVS